MRSIALRVPVQRTQLGRGKLVVKDDRVTIQPVVAQLIHLARANKVPGWMASAAAIAANHLHPRRMGAGQFHQDSSPRKATPCAHLRPSKGAIRLVTRGVAVSFFRQIFDSLSPAS